MLHPRVSLPDSGNWARTAIAVGQRLNPKVVLYSPQDIEGVVVGIVGTTRPHHVAEQRLLPM